MPETDQPAPHPDHASPLSVFHSFVSAVLTSAQDIGHHIEGDAAVVLGAVQSALAPLEKQLAALVAGEAMTLEKKVALIVAAKVSAALPAILAEAEKDLNAALVVASASEVAALGAKVAVGGAVL